jgi:hypothetical protein
LPGTGVTANPARGDAWARWIFNDQKCLSTGTGITAVQTPFF